jgi:hypothetical protein
VTTTSPPQSKIPTPQISDVVPSKAPNPYALPRAYPRLISDFLGTLQYSPALSTLAYDLQYLAATHCNSKGFSTSSRAVNVALRASGITPVRISSGYLYRGVGIPEELQATIHRRLHHPLHHPSICRGTPKRPRRCVPWYHVPSDLIINKCSKSLSCCGQCKIVTECLATER